MEYKRGSHYVYYCDYHLIFVTKYRRKIFNEGVFAYFDKRLLEVKKQHPQIEFKEVNHDKDHIHMLVSIPPTMSVGKVVRLIKSNTAKDLKQKFPVLKEIYWGTESVWSAGYFVSTVGVNEKIVQEYIQRQGEEDSGQAKLELA
jgi:putative transposase